MTTVVSALLAVAFAGCSSSFSNASPVNADSCGAVTPGDARPVANRKLGPVGGGGGGDDWCDVWYGTWQGGPCCAVELTSCDASGVVTAVSFNANGCASGSSSSSGSGSSDSSGSSSGSPPPGYETAALAVTGDATNRFGSASITSVTCNAGGGTSFAFPFYSDFAVDVPASGSVQVEGDSNHVIYWRGALRSSTSGAHTTIEATLQSDEPNAPGSLAISGWYDCQ